MQGIRVPTSGILCLAVDGHGDLGQNFKAFEDDLFGRVVHELMDDWDDEFSCIL
jgi:hypothetical protein